MDASLRFLNVSFLGGVPPLRLSRVAQLTIVRASILYSGPSQRVYLCYGVRGPSDDLMAHAALGEAWSVIGWDVVQMPEAARPTAVEIAPFSAVLDLGRIDAPGLEVGRTYGLALWAHEARGDGPSSDVLHAIADYETGVRVARLDNILVIAS